MHHTSWDKLFNEYQIDLDDIYVSEIPIYPPKEQVFRVFEMPVSDIKLVFLGQDPYHNPGQAEGLSFSVPEGIKPPPSLQNIFKELQQEFPDRDYKFKTGNLQKWVNQGIFLLNTALTVQLNSPNSHSKMWRDFTDDVIRYIVEHNQTCIFLLLGNNAKQKAHLIGDNLRIVEGVHPSPLSASRGFFGSNIFKSIESLLSRKFNWDT
jgi:uracil-DNA glycosylase